MRKIKTQISFAVTAKLISAFVFASQIVQSLFFQNLKSQASSYLLLLYSLVCVGPGWKPEHWFSHVVAHITLYIFSFQLVSAVRLMLTCVAGPRTGPMTLTGHSFLDQPRRPVLDQLVTIPQEPKQVRPSCICHKSLRYSGTQNIEISSLKF